jgi:hypothetical protein
MNFWFLLEIKEATVKAYHIKEGDIVEVIIILIII